MRNMNWCLMSLMFISLCIRTDQSVRKKRQILPNQPRILTENGHLIFQSALNHNITFRSGSGGVFLDNLDLKNAVNQTHSNKEDISRLRESLDSSNVTSRVTSLENQLRGYPNIVRNVPYLMGTVISTRTQAETTASLLNTRLSHVEAQMTNVRGINDVQTQVSHLRAKVETLENLVLDTHLVDDGDDDDGGGVGGIRQLRMRVQEMEDTVRHAQTLLTTDECQSNPCLNGGTCVDMYNGYLCRCPPNWQGPNCSDDVNECEFYAGTDLGCQNGATCSNTPGSFRCQCATNWYGIHCREQHNNCMGASHKELCGHGTCVNEASILPGQASYRCVCEAGWTQSSSDPACIVDIDECANGTRCSLVPLVHCINIPGSFVCGSCPPGYTGNGHTCYDINECTINNGGCSTSPRVECINAQGSWACGPCPGGYQGDGVSCRYVGACSENNGGCHQLATCSETSGYGIICSCHDGYLGSGVGPNGCQEQHHAGACASNPCDNGGVCTPVGSTGFTCACRPRFSGPTCSMVVDACLSYPCQNGGTCVSQTQAPGYICQCTEDFTGTNCQLQQQECGGHLIGETGTFRYPRETGALYPHSVSCVWVISTSSDKILTVTFPAFALEPSNVCNFDFLQIHDGSTSASRLIGRYCGTDPPNAGTLNSTTNQLYLWFQSDESYAHDGFVVHWTSHLPTCGGHLNGSDHGAISSPGYPNNNYPHNQDCVWTVAVSPGSNIQFTFAHLALEYHPDCGFDYLEIRDGQLSDAPVINLFCSSVTPVPIQTTGPYAYVRFHSDDTLSDRGFNITYVAHTEGRQGCGGTLSGPEGEVMSPGYPQPYQHNIQCVWVITVAPGNSVQLSFLDLDLETSSSCTADYLKVKDGSNQMTPTLGIFCATDLPAMVTSSSNILGIELHTDESVSGRGFKAQWTTACGGTFSGLQGQIQSPQWPQFYPLSKMCDYLIQVPYSHVVRFELTDVQLGESVDCTYNYIEFHDGANQAAAMIGSRLCSNATLSRIMSTGSQMFVRFSTDGSVNNRGFHGRFTAAETGPEGCGGVHNANLGIIASPGHPNEYPHGVNCTWYINVTPGLVIRLIFHTFSFFPSVDGDYVEIYDNSTMAEESWLGRYHGSVLPGMVTSTDNVLVVYMHTDASIAREGFSASFVAINASRTCGAALTSAAGVITSPNYPNNYPYNRQCEWTITAADGNQILINITDMDIQQSRDCFFDFLEIRNGGDISSPLMQKFCGQLLTPQVLLSHSNRLYLRFKSFFISTHRGFRLEYTSASSGCGGDLTTPTGVIVSPNYPQDFTHTASCSWSITVSRGSTITLLFTDFDLFQYRECRFHSLEVREEGPFGASLGKFCGNTLPGPIRSQSNRLWLAYRIRIYFFSSRFRLQYHSDCNNHLTGISGVIESPNFPSPYNHQTNCTWVIEAPRGNRINVTFAAFRLRSHSHCQSDFLQIGDGGDSNARELTTLCGSTIPDPLQSRGSLMWLHFVTVTSAAHEGFRLEWLVDGCGGHLSGSTGVITSPNYPNRPTQSDLECQWIITVDTGKHINLIISHFDLDNYEGCHVPFLKIIAGSNRNGIELTHLCSRLTSAEVLHTTGNTALVIFTYTPAWSNSGTGFRLTYTAVSGGCGGNFTARTATITSINYPHNYEPNTECEWSITVAPGHVVNLNFSDFDVQGLSCTNNSVQLYDGPNENADLIVNLCGRILSNNTAYRSTGNQMFIRMKTDAYTNRGFRATYTTGCGGSLNADIDGEIVSPGYPGKILQNMDCVWNIMSSFNDRHVSLTFTYMDLRTETYVAVAEGWWSSLNQTLNPGETQYSGSSLPATITSEGSALSVVFHSGRSSSGYGFRAVYSSAYAACGGEFTAQSGRFMSPGYPDGYSVNIECVWEIKPSPGSHIQMSFPNFQLDPLGDVNDDYVEIRSPNVSGALVGRWIQNNAPTNLTSLFGAWVKFRSNEDRTAPGFVAEYSTSYGGNLVGDSGEIASPQYPSYYPANSNCRWTVLVSQGMRIRVTFSFISIEESVFNICYFDYVAIFEGTQEDNVLLGKFCGSDLPGPLYSETNQITVTFISESAYEDLGFLLNWLAVPHRGVPSVVATTPGCGGQLVATDTLQNITSPGYPDVYPNDLDCFWTISVPEGNTVVVNIISINLQSDIDCFLDYLRFYDGDTADARVITTYCHQTHNMGLIHSTANVMGIMFHTDSSDSGPGFVLMYEMGCGGFMQSSTGVIKSTGYPSNYPANQNCTWTVAVQPGKTIRLDFEDQFNIADSGECNHDYLMLLNGFSTQSPPLFPNGSANTNGRYCRSSKPQRMETSSSFLLANFVSDESDQEIGFSLNYSSVSLACGGELRLTDSMRSGYFMSPNYPENYPHNVDCIWLIMAPAARRIQVDFEGNFSIEANASCSVDYIEFHDGGTTNAQRIGSPLCGTTLPGTVVSTGNFMLARFLTDSTVTHAGFKAKYSIATCGGRIRAASGVISSPNYLEIFGNNLGCEWNIAGPVGHFLRINITELRPRSLLYCTANTLQIRDGNSTGRIIFDNCGNGTSQSVETSDSIAYIRFRADGSVQNSGFRLVFQASVEECGGQLNTPTGVLTSPNYPNQYPHTRMCTWDITVPLGRRVTLTFSDFRLEGPSSQFCEWDYVEVINGVLLDSPSLDRFCGETVPAEPVESSGNTMRVRFYTDGSVSNAGFRATYTSDREAECGGYITQHPGQISSPGFGNGTYDHRVQCVWQLNSDMGNSTIRLRFNHMNMQYHSSCIFDFVEIREGTDINAPLVGKFCGPDHFIHYDAILIPGNHAWVRFKSNGLHSHAGFTLSFDFIECGGVFINPQGVITNPNSSNIPERVMECAWKIVGPEGSRIKVNFTRLCPSYYMSHRLQILNGGLPDSPVFSDFDRHNRSTSYLLQSSAVRLVLYSRMFYSCDEFRMEYTAETEGCGGLFHGQQGSFSSPNYPSSYPHNTQCTWDINVQANFVVSLHFNPPFDLEARDCTKDYVEVFDALTNGTLISLGRWCHNIEPPDLRSSSTRLVVVFQSDAATNGNGFSASWDVACGGVFMQVYGQIISPGYPKLYAANLSCDYIISPSSRSYIRLGFNDFELEDGHGCQNDYLRVWQGNASTGVTVSEENRNSTHLGTFCGNNRPDYLFAVSQMTIQFRTDGSEQYKGFQAYYYSYVCGGVFNDLSNHIHTPYGIGGFINSVNCSWNITVTPGRIITLRLYHFEIAASPQCQDDHVTIYDGPDTDSPMVGRYCGYRENIPEAFTSTGNHLYITVSASADTSIGFYGYYTSNFGPAAGCGGVLRQSSGRITSLDADGDGRYEDQMNCEWLIFVNDNKVVTITVTDLDLQQPSYDHCRDKLKIYDGLTKDSPVIAELCGNSTPSYPILASSNVVLVVFYTDWSENSAGFNATFGEIDAICGGAYNATDTPQTLTSPYYPNSTGTAVRCTWIIDSGGANQRVRLRVMDLQLQTTQRCVSEQLILRDQPKHWNGQEQTYCGNIIPHTFNSMESQVKIIYHLATTSHSRGFQLTYQIADCNENISKPSGLITSGRLSSHNCTIEVTSPENTTLALYFLALYTPGDTCERRYLEIRNSSSATVARLCGNYSPSPIFLTDNMATVRCITDNVNQLCSYDITFISSTQGPGCGGNLTGLRTGTFTSPGYPGRYPEPMTCVWYITPPAAHRIYWYLYFSNTPGATDGCGSNYVSVYSGFSNTDPLVGRYCEEIGYYRWSDVPIMVRWYSSGNSSAPIFVFFIHADMHSSFVTTS